MSNKYAAPAKKVVKNPLESQPETLTAVSDEEPTSPVTPLVKPVMTPKVQTLCLTTDEYVGALLGTKRYTRDQLANIQLAFISTITSSLQLNYIDYCAYMEYLMTTIRDNPKAFNMARCFSLFSYIPVNKCSEETRRRFYNYMEAVITLTKNIQYRHRVANLIDIPTLIKGLAPSSAEKIRTYFTSLYNN